jgi:hypothetical protein
MNKQIFTPDPQDQQAFEDFLQSQGATTDYSTWTAEQLIERINFLEDEQQSLID